MVKTLCFHCRGHGSTSGWETKIPHATRHGLIIMKAIISEAYGTVTVSQALFKNLTSLSHFISCWPYVLFSPSQERRVASGQVSYSRLLIVTWWNVSSHPGSGLLSTKLDCPPRPGGCLGSLPPLITQHPGGHLQHPLVVFSRVAVCLHLSWGWDLMEIPTPRPSLETPRSFRALENELATGRGLPAPCTEWWTE